MQSIEINNQVLGGLADSKYLGIANSVHKMVGFDLHSEPGVMKVNQALVKISGELIDGLIKKAVPCSNGEIYLFSADSGKIWRIKEDHTTVELCYTTVAGAGESKCLGAEEYNDYIIWATELRLHRIPITNAESESTWTTVTLNWQTLTKGDKEYHPFDIQNDVLYIGDGPQLAQVDGDTFSASAMNKWPERHRVSALQKYLTGLLFGTIVPSGIVSSLAAFWNTWSTNVSFADDLPENGINSFLKMDNYAIAQCGKKGNFYSYNGSAMSLYKRIPGNWGGPFGANQAIVHSDANLNAGGIPMFGLSNISGNPADQGIYSLGHYSPEYPIVFSMEFVISTGNVANIEIGSVFMVGTDMFVAWKDSNDETPIYGIDKLDKTAKFNGAYFDTRLIQSDRRNMKEFSVDVFYRSLPENTDILLNRKVNNGNWKEAPIQLIHDVNRKRKHTKVKIRGNDCQFRIITSADGNNAPEIDFCEISFN
ncbi:MAG: hypothetical protein ABIC19_00600 [Patescibacteria group bacterium]|nr:hypothetical protein [Patescibacteria group bacterium]